MLMWVFLLWREQAGHHSLMGSTKDPADGKAVAGSVFAAVVVYAVCDSFHTFLRCLEAFEEEEGLGDGSLLVGGVKK